MKRYDAVTLEAKWQTRWEKDRLHEARDFDPRPKFYFLTMYPYPSGDLHIGHWYAMAPSDWCPKDRTTLAREQVVGEDRVCERCGTPVIKKNLEQWFLKITAYADELLDFSGIEWPDRVRTLQENWIGKSIGVEFELKVQGHPGVSFRVFTTRPDTVYGMTFAVLAPEHPLVDQLTTPDRRADVEAYKFKAARQSDIERLSTERERDGVPIGAFAIHPMNGERTPIFIADYVLLTYGTGAIQGVPAHDARDFDFARKYHLPIPVVVAPPGWDGRPLAEAYLGEGTMVNSGPFTGLPSREGWERIADYVEERGIGQRKANYRLHDWLISRQRYWGTPIPIIYCSHCGIVPVPESDLPVRLPEDAEFLPTGESPLKLHEGFRRTRCPQCGGEAERETDTMDTFIDSAWYQYRYVSPHDPQRPFDPEAGRYWLPVDQYTGGVEHAVMHLLYTRFWTKVMRDLGMVGFGEPMLRLFNQGVILGEDGEKMSKSRGNVVNPDAYVNSVGADTVRAYLMFIGPWEGGGPWNSRGIEGVHRFLQRVWNLVHDTTETGKRGNGETRTHKARGPQPETRQSNDGHELQHWTHKTIKKVTEDLEGFHFNTAIAALMEFVNYMYKVRDEQAGATPWRGGEPPTVLILEPQ